jgi:hypothetical protein
MACRATRLLERILMTLFLVGRAAKVCRAVEIAISSAKYGFNLFLSPSVTVNVAVGAVAEDPVVVVSQIAPPIPTIPFFSDEQVATTMP